MKPASAAHRFSYRGWDVRILLRGAPERGEVQAEADLVEAFTRHHSLPLAGHHAQAATALGALSSQARALIDRRPTRG